MAIQSHLVDESFHMDCQLQKGLQKKSINYHNYLFLLKACTVHNFKTIC